MAWTCPHCGRDFRTPQASHACRPSQSLVTVFAGREIWLPVYQRLRQAFEETGLSSEVYCTSGVVIWRATSAFAYLHPKKTQFTCSVLLDRFRPDIPALRTLTNSPRRVWHEVKIDPDELDPTLNLLMEAYAGTQQ